MRAPRQPIDRGCSLRAADRRSSALQRSKQTVTVPKSSVGVVLSISDSENAPEDEDDLYAVIYALEDNCAGGKIYQDLMRAEQPPPLVLV